MRSIHLRKLLVAACVAVCSFGVVCDRVSSQVPGTKPKTAPGRLLDGELAELLDGDLERAVRIYRSLADDSKAPETVRARALLYLARCHRKLGQLAQAERLLRALVKRTKLDQAVLAEARAFLGELEAPAAKRTFDWISAMESSPEIQARVFKLAMDVVEPYGEAGTMARKQLRSLGRLAVPVLSRLCDASREPVHRQHLALILAHGGDYDRLAVLFGRGNAPIGSGEEESVGQFFRSVIGLSADRKRALLAALDRIDARPEVCGLTDFLRICAGDVSDFSAKLRSMESVNGKTTLLAWPERGFNAFEIIPPLVRGNRGLEAAMADRMKDTTLPALNLDFYFETLRDAVLDHLDGPTVVARLRRLVGEFDFDNSLGPICDRLVARNDIATLRLLARDTTLRLDIRRVRFEGFRKSTGTIPAAWGTFLAEAGLHAELSHYALRDDAFVPPLVRLLRERAARAPKFKAIYTSPPPSATFLDAIHPLLHDDDPITRRIAMDAFALAAKGVGPDAFERLAELAAEGRAREERRTAVYTLLKRFDSDGRRAAEIVAVWLPWFADQYGVEKDGFRFLARTPRNAAWVRPPLSPAAAARLVAPAIESIQMKRGAVFFQRLLGMLSKGDVSRVLQPLLVGDASPTTRRAVFDSVRHIGRPRPVFDVINGVREALQTPAGRAFVKATALDRKAPIHLRAQAYDLAYPTSRAWFDWAAVSESGDEIGMSLIRHLRHELASLDASAVAKILRHVLAHPERKVRERAIQYAQGHITAPWAREILERGVADQSESNQYTALLALMMTGTADILPVLHRVLTDAGHAALRLRCMDQIADYLIRVASPDSLRPLAALLDDPKVSVRASALVALREIKKAIEEKKEWKRLVKQLDQAGGAEHDAKK